MAWSKLLVIALGGALLAAPAFAQDDDELVNLTPKKKADPKPKPKPKVKAKPVAKPPVVSNDDELAPLTPAKGDLVLKVAGAPPRRAKVSIDNSEVGSLPLPSQSLATGEHTVSIRAPGHAPWSKKFNITANKSTDIPVVLEANAAILSVSADTTGAAVSVNGKPVGMAPIEELEVSPGTATISVRKEGYKDSSQTLKLVAGKEYPLSVKLGAPLVAAAPIVAVVAPPPVSDRPEATNLYPPTNENLGVTDRVEESSPVYTRWYFWVGAVAVVAAVAVGTAVAVSSTQVKPLNEKQICGETGCDSCIGFMCTVSPGAGIRPIGPFSF